eukprot:gene1345-7720_t
MDAIQLHVSAVTGRIRDTVLGHKAVVRGMEGGRRISSKQYKAVLNHPLLTTASQKLWEKREQKKFDWLNEFKMLPDVDQY